MALIWINTANPINFSNQHSYESQQNNLWKFRYEFEVCLTMLLYGKNHFSSAFTTVATIFNEWKTLVLAKSFEYPDAYPWTSKTTRNLPFHTRKLEFKFFFSELLHVDDFIEIYIITKTAEIIKEERWH